MHSIKILTLLMKVALPVIIKMLVTMLVITMLVVMMLAMVVVATLAAVEMVVVVVMAVVMAVVVAVVVIELTDADSAYTLVEKHATMMNSIQMMLPYVQLLCMITTITQEGSNFHLSNQLK